MIFIDQTLKDIESESTYLFFYLLGYKVFGVYIGEGFNHFAAVRIGQVTMGTWLKH